jgi:hypothetical protein
LKSVQSVQPRKQIISRSKDTLLAISRSVFGDAPYQALTSVYLPDAGRVALALGTTYAIRGVVTLLDGA